MIKLILITAGCIVGTWWLTLLATAGLVGLWPLFPLLFLLPHLGQINRLEAEERRFNKYFNSIRRNEHDRLLP